MKVRMAQISPVVGDFRGNCHKIIEEINMAFQSADKDIVDVLLFPELALIGYPPRDILYNEYVHRNNDRAVDSIHKHLIEVLSSNSINLTVIVGGVHRVKGNAGSFKTYNAAWIIDKHDVRCVHKKLLPCYDVFDESRYFNSGLDEAYTPVNIRIANSHNTKNVLCDVLICEDVWNFKHNSDLKREFNMMPGSYGVDPVSQCRGDGPIFVLNASPYWKGKIEQATRLMCEISAYKKRPVFYCNQVGGFDDVVFHGGSLAIWPDKASGAGRCDTAYFFRMSLFKENSDSFYGGDTHTCLPHVPYSKLLTNDEIDVWKRGSDITTTLNDKLIDEKDFDLYCTLQAIIMGVKEYARKTGFKRAVLGSSGGIDSAVAAFVAREAFGPFNVDAISMPSKFSSHGSISDASKLADNLQLNYIYKPITGIYESVKESFLSATRQEFSNSVVDENIQPRARALMLMTHSNDTNSLLLSTGNKSELSVGYCTIYGDMCGGFGTISDLWKTEVYAIARFINKHYLNSYGCSPIPQAIINKEPSAELKENQVDTDSLPPYSILDPILIDIVEHALSLDRIIKKHLKTDFNTIKKIWDLYSRAEFKRQQMCNSPKVSERSFGSGRRIPITARLTHMP